MKRTSNQLTTGLFRPATGLTPSTTGLTPNPSPRGEGSNMQCYYNSTTHGISPCANGRDKNMQCYYNVRDKLMQCSGNAFHSPLPLERGWG